MKTAALETEYNYCPQCESIVDPIKQGRMWVCPKHGTDTTIAPKHFKSCKSMVIGKVNATFTIIAAKPGRPAGHGEEQCEVVLGFRRLTGGYCGITADYVTWLYNPLTNSYFHGHYTEDFEAAVKDYERRS